MTTSVTPLSVSSIFWPSSGPNESNWNRCGDSTTPLREEKRWAVVVRAMAGQPFVGFRRGSSDTGVDDAGGVD